MLDVLKNQFLAAIYEKNGGNARSVYEEICRHVRDGFPDIPETDEKYLRQIQTVFRRFRPFLRRQCGPGTEDAYKRLQTLLHRLVRHQSGSPGHVAYDRWRDRLNLHGWQMERIFETAITFQMTSGCSNFCRRCNEWALPKVRSHFSFQAALAILEKLAARGNTDLALYGASDPLDWEEDGLALADLLDHGPRGTNYSLLTKLPRGRQDSMKRLMENGISLSVSVTGRNRDRVAALEAETGLRFQKQHDSEDLMIPAGLDEDFLTVKPSITDAYGTEITPGGAFVVIPTFTSPLYPFGHQKIPVTRETLFFPVKKIGRPALLADYFKPLEVVGIDGVPYVLPGLLPVQVETILLDNGSDALTPPGMRSLKEYFDIFGETARRRRKKMTPKVMRRLKKQYLGNAPYRTLAEHDKRIFREKINAHLFLCRKKNMTMAKILAVSYFLHAVAAYLEAKPAGQPVLAFILKQEFSLLENQYGPLTGDASIPDMITAGRAGAWEIFRYFALGMVMGNTSGRVADLLASRAARYDAGADRFVPD